VPMAPMDVARLRGLIEAQDLLFKVRAAAPDQGVHTGEVLREFGYSAAAIDDLKTRGVV